VCRDVTPVETDRQTTSRAQDVSRDTESTDALRYTGTMTTPARQVHYSYATYLALEEESSVRHEYLDGEIHAMAGGTPDHAALAAATIGLLRNRLPVGCRVFTSDLPVRVTATGLSTYPDVSVVIRRCSSKSRATQPRHTTAAQDYLGEPASRWLERSRLPVRRFGGPACARLRPRGQRRVPGRARRRLRASASG